MNEKENGPKFIKRVFTKKELYSLRAAIKGFREESIRIRKKEIYPNKHHKRWYAWEKKRTLGADARFFHLSYGFLLGKKYSSMEEYCPLRHSGKHIYASQVIYNICKSVDLFPRVPSSIWKWQREDDENFAEAIKNWILYDEVCYVKDPPSPLLKKKLTKNVGQLSGQ